MHVKGATSFEQLRTVEGVVYDTFQRTCEALNLWEDDKEWEECLREAASTHMAPQLRQLFAMILFNPNSSTPSKPDDLWAKFSDDMCEDVLRQPGMKADDCPDDYIQGQWEARRIQMAKSVALFHIDGILKGMSSSLKNFPMLPQDYMEHVGDLPQILLRENEMRRLRFILDANENVAKLNGEQYFAYDAIMEAIQGNGPKMFFIDGLGGTGKSFVYNTLIGNIQSLRKDVIVVATSGIAALILHDGRTAHSVFKIPIPVLHDSVCSIAKEDEVTQRIRDAAAIFWDEAVMQHRFGFEAVDRTLRDLLQVDLPFAGKVVVFGGDFRQILPIVVKGSPSQIEVACLKNSPLWAVDKITTLKLKVNMRVSKDENQKPFVDFLLRVGEGTEPTFKIGSTSDFIHIPDDFIFTSAFQDNRPPTQTQFLHAIYLGIDKKVLDPTFLMSRVILSPKNDSVDGLNALATATMPGRCKVYYSQDSIFDDGASPNYAIEFLHSQKPSGMPPYELILKVGQPVILLRNLDPTIGLCNGTRMVIKKFGEKYIEVQIVAGRARNQTAFLPRLSLTTADNAMTPVKFTRRQFPIKPAFAMTINKAQGQTLDTVGLFLPEPVFSHGQLYVALSRCTNPKNLKVMIENGQGEDGRFYTRNIVYPGVLTK